MEAASDQPPVETSAASSDPIATAAPEPHVHGVEVTSTTVHIHDVSVERPAVVKYLESIARDKQEIALIHALEVGITELVARRARFKSALQ